MVAPAYAATLTSASFTASTPYTYTNAQNTRYDYGFTTATTSTLSKVTMSVPAGTGGSNRYLALNGGSNNNASTPDSVQNSITGDIDIRTKIAPTGVGWNWTGGTGFRYLVTKQNIGASQYSYGLVLDSNSRLQFLYSSDGSTQINLYSSLVPFTGTATGWVRVTFSPNNGASGNTVSFYTSTNGVTWTLLGTPQVTAGITSIDDSTAPVRIGAINGAAGAFDGRTYYADIRNGINGPIVNKFDPGDDSATSPLSWNSSDTNAETWTINSSGTNLPADIATDLNVSNVTGLPTGGTANYRFIDGVASYYFPTATSVPSGTPCTVSLQGFTNTATPGSYASTITTYDNSGTPVAVDSVTTSALVFTADAANTTASVTIDPSMTFTVAGQTSVCNGQSASNFQTGSTATAVGLGHLSPSTVGGGAQAVSIADNAGGGFTVYLRTSGTTPNAMRDTNSHYIADVSGTNASPGAAPVAGTAGFGYTSGDTSTPFTSNTWAMLTNSNDSVLIGAAGTYAKSSCIGYEVAVAPSTPASSYSTTVVYTAVPVY